MFKSILRALWDFIVFLLGGSYPHKKRVSSSTTQKIKEKWNNEVTFALESRDYIQLRQALITTDKLVDTALGEIVDGVSMSDRLKAARELFEWDMYDRLWKAHKVRNSLVHDLDYDPTYLVLEEAINDLRLGLYEIGIQL